jgi:hypothetical protein
VAETELGKKRNNIVLGTLRHVPEQQYKVKKNFCIHVNLVLFLDEQSNGTLVGIDEDESYYSKMINQTSTTTTITSRVVNATTSQYVNSTSSSTIMPDHSSLGPLYAALGLFFGLAVFTIGGRLAIRRIKSCYQQRGHNTNKYKRAASEANTEYELIDFN